MAWVVQYVGIFVREVHEHVLKEVITEGTHHVQGNKCLSFLVRFWRGGGVVDEA